MDNFKWPQFFGTTERGGGIENGFFLSSCFFLHKNPKQIKTDFFVTNSPFSSFNTHKLSDGKPDDSVILIEIKFCVSTSCTRKLTLLAIPPSSSNFSPAAVGVQLNLRV